MTGIVIVGAGPAGLACAAELARTGKKVTVLERNAVIGPKVCAGGLTALDSSFSFPEGPVREFSDQRFRIDDTEQVITLKRPLRTIPRHELGQHQLREAQRLGVIVRTSTTVERITDRAIILAGGERIPYDILIGADGAFSIVRKHLGLPSRHYQSFQYIIGDAKHCEMEWIFSPRTLGMGYAWIFPRKDGISVGVYFDNKTVPMKTARGFLDTLVEQRFAGKPKRFEGFMVNTAYAGVEFGSVYLIGEAAGLASAATGEGIGFALRSGTDVAKRILDETHEMDDLRKLLVIKRRQERFLRIGTAIPSLQPFFLRRFCRLMRSPWFQRYFGN